MEVELLKAKLADARSEIRSKDQELAVLDAELQCKIRSMETVPEDTPVRHFAAPAPVCSTHADNDQWSAVSLGRIQSQMEALRKEVQQHEARIASQLAGLSAGARALAAQVAHERKERTAVLAEVRRDFEDMRTLLHDTQAPCWQNSFDQQAAHADLHADESMPSHLQEAHDLELSKVRQSLEAFSDQFVCKSDPQWLQASETMVRLSETCGQLSAEVALLRSRVDDAGSGRPQAGESLSSTAPSCRAGTLEASVAAPLADEVEFVSARELTTSLRQVEKEVGLLAKAIISGQQEMTVRLGEERSVRRAAEAVLDARIRTVEHQVKRRVSNAGFTAGESPAATPVMTPVVSAARLPSVATRPATGAGACAAA